MTDTLRDLELLVRSRYGLICLDTAEEKRAEPLLAHLADRLSIPLFSWTGTKGLRKAGEDACVYGSQNPAAALGHVELSAIPALYVFYGLAGELSDKLLVQKLKDAAAGFEKRTGAIILVDPNPEIPAALAVSSTVVPLPAPDAGEYRGLLERIIRDLSARIALRVNISPKDTDRLMNNLKGLSLLEAEKALTRVMIEDGQLSPEDISRVVQAKKEAVLKNGLLEYYPVEENLADIAGLRGLKCWLAKRREMIADPEKARAFGLSFPKGILLVGVQGCGKSLCAKAVAMEWGLPLLKLDPSGLYNKYIGESERNFNRAVKTADKMAPVVLWIDEIEKAFASSPPESDGGVSQRIFASFLSWLQEKKSEVFVVATANDISRLPPEFIRKGRFDEIFFVDLPDAAARKTIFGIHLAKRKCAPAGFDLDALAAAAEGFSGAELEQCVVSALYTAFSLKSPLATGLVMAEIRATNPLSRTMAEKITALREWAYGRTVPAQ